MDALTRRAPLANAPGLAEAMAVSAAVLFLEYLLTFLSPPPPRGSDAAFWRLAWVRAGEAALIIGYWRARVGSFGSLGLSADGFRRSVKVAAAGCLLLGLLAALCELTTRLLWSSSFLGGMAAQGIEPSPALLVAGVLAGPLAEELFFRALLYSSFRVRFGVALSVLFTTALFALAHLPAGQVPLIQAVGGVFFALALEFSGSIIAPVLVHTAGNLAIFSLPLLVK